MNFTLKTPSNKAAAFTLIEVMIALSVFIVSILSISTLSVQSVRTNQKNIDSLRASFFAQQGLEAIREIRDSNSLQNQYWLGKTNNIWGENLSSMEKEGSYFSVNLQTNKIDEQNGPWIIKKIDPENYKENITDTNFVRYVYLKPVEYSKDDPDYVNKIYVESIVKWNSYDKDQQVKLYTELTDWR